MRLLHLGLSALLLSTSAAAAQTSEPWAALDARRVLPEQRERYLRFLEANWVTAREAARRQGDVLEFEILVRPAESVAPGGWDILLITVYRDSTTAANAEAVFRPILSARETVRIDGLGSRELSVGLWTTLVRRHPIGQ